ncbi:hypothetical protein ANAEL_02471 [Anaerolineales bacterium]|nr:hypothetical protein ANAEL_02471 [Anaerolineales bacterium]
MSYQEKNITVSLVSHLLIVVYYLVNLFQMQQAGGLVSTKIFSLWAVVIVGAIIVNIIGSILTNILLSIVHAIKTRSEQVENFIEDERDKLIGLKGSKVSHIAFSIGVLIAMLTFAFGQPPLVMFSLLILASIVGEIIGDLSQLYLYRKGF